MLYPGHGAMWRLVGRLLAWGCLGTALAASQAQADTRLWQIGSPREGVTLPVLVESGAVAPRAALISLDTGNGKAIIEQPGDSPAYGQPATLITRNRTRLTDRGIIVLTPGLPSDRPKGINFAWRQSLEHRADLQALLAEVHKRYPGIPVVVHGYFSGATSVLNLAEGRTNGVDGYIITSGELARHRDDALSRIRTRGLVVHPLSNHCNSIPLPEARAVAAGAHWKFVAVGDSQTDWRETCAPQSRAGLGGQDEAFVNMLADWAGGAEAPATLGTPVPAVAYEEQVFMVKGATVGLSGHYSIELSLYTPPGEGPFPLVLYNHGDIQADSPLITGHVRYRDMIMVNEFIALGYAVALPARPGVGHSDGTYQHYATNSGIYVGAATSLLQKGRAQLDEGLAALDFLRTVPAVDASRVIMAGQSAGGFAVSCLGLDETPPPWLKGIVNFSGGRTDTPEGRVANQLNKGMVSAFGYLGKTSRIPSLWLFAENDSRYTAETIRASHEAFITAGGVAELKLYPPVKGKDGHYLYHAPALWREDLRAFLDGLGLPARQGPLPPPHPAAASPSQAPT